MKILVIGSGGREHALVWKLAQSSRVSRVYVAPGNGGTESEGAENIPIQADDIEGLVHFAKENKTFLFIQLHIVFPHEFIKDDKHVFVIFIL